MHCLLCENLERTFEARRMEYIESGSLAYFRVSKKFAAYKNVEMERARIELQEHQSVCVSAANVTGRLPIGTLLRPPQPERFHKGRIGAAA
jgi:hypothetical protein